MSGHSKWANIKHKKEKSDAQKGKIFSKLGREIMICVKEGGADPEANQKLKDIIAKAKACNMPNDNISRSIKRAAGGMDATNYEVVWYEGYGPEGVALMVKAMTDNRNRTAGDLRHYFDKYGGNLGSTGCVAFMFNERGVMLVERSQDVDEDKLMLDAMDLGADDFKIWDDSYEITTLPQDFYTIREGLEKIGYKIVSAAIEMSPVSFTSIKDPKHLEQMEKLIEQLDELEDIQEVFHNLDVNA